MEIIEFVKKIAEQFDETDINEFSTKTAFHQLEEYSSLISLSIMAMIDEEYDVQLNAEEMRNANTIQELYETVQSHLQ